MASSHHLPQKSKISLIYHDFFNFPLTKSELKRWSAGKRLKLSSKKKIKIKSNSGYYFLSGRESIVKKRVQNESSSAPKLKQAQKASKALAGIPTIKLIAITGSLAMENAGKHSDIDLMVITNKNTLWITRLITLIYLKILNISVRRSNEPEKPNALCLNLWLDQTDLKFREKNIYLAHEIAQIVPIVNKNKIYERFLSSNSWILDYWPSSVKLKKAEFKPKSHLLSLFEPIAYKLQLWHMRGKITRETVTKTRAMFHPVDWGEKVQKELEKRGISVE